MGAEHNDLVSADEARRLLDGIVPGPWRTERPIPLSRTIVADFDGEVVAIASIALTSPGTERANTRLVAAAPDLARTVIAREAEVAELRAEINRLHDALRATARACTLPEDTTPEALPAQVEACIRDLSGQIERLTLAATATTGAEDALAGLVALKVAAARAYLEMDGGRTDAITPEVDSGAEPRLALTLDLGGTEGGEPWQALVIYDAGMGTVPVTSGECCGTPLAAVASLREDLEPNHNDDTEDDCEFDHV